MRRRWNSCRYEKGGGVGETDVHFRPRDFRISDFPGFSATFGIPIFRIFRICMNRLKVFSLSFLLPNWLVVIFPIPTSFQEFENVPQIASFVHILSVHYLSYNNICEVLPPNERFCTVVAFGDIPQNAYFSIFYLNFPYCIFRITGPIHPSRIAIMPFEPTDWQTNRLSSEVFLMSVNWIFLYLHALVLISYLRPQSGGGAQIRKISNLCNKGMQCTYYLMLKQPSSLLGSCRVWECGGGWGALTVCALGALTRWLRALFCLFIGQPLAERAAVVTPQYPSRNHLNFTIQFHFTANPRLFPL